MDIENRKVIAILNLRDLDDVKVQLSEYPDVSVKSWTY